jgi:hypothetical protein
MLIVQCGYDSSEGWEIEDEIRSSIDETNKLVTSKTLTTIDDLNSIFIVAYPFMGDANLDGSVDVGDLGILAANYGESSGATWFEGDFNGDGEVDVGDLGILAANYGAGSAAGSDEVDSMHLQVTYVNSPTTDLDRFTVSLVSDSSDCILAGWDGDFTGTLGQIWNYNYNEEDETYYYSSTAIGNPSSNSSMDTHYNVSNYFDYPSEDNDLSGSLTGEGYGTYLQNGSFTFSGTTITLAQVVVPTGESFQITGYASDSNGTTYYFNVTTSQSNCGSFSPTDD